MHKFSPDRSVSGVVNPAVNWNGDSSPVAMIEMNRRWHPCFTFSSEIWEGNERLCRTIRRENIAQRHSGEASAPSQNIPQHIFITISLQFHANFITIPWRFHWFSCGAKYPGPLFPPVVHLLIFFALSTPKRSETGSFWDLLKSIWQFGSLKEEGGDQRRTAGLAYCNCLLTAHTYYAGQFDVFIVFDLQLDSNLFFFSFVPSGSALYYKRS